LYEESKNKEKELKAPIIFPNSFINEFQITLQYLRNNPDKYSKERISEEIEFNIKRITANNVTVSTNTNKINDLETEKKRIIGKSSKYFGK
jgi:hypothetical protein